MIRLLGHVRWDGAEEAESLGYVMTWSIRCRLDLSRVEPRRFKHKSTNMPLIYNSMSVYRNVLSHGKSRSATLVEI